MEIEVPKIELHSFQLNEKKIDYALLIRSPKYRVAFITAKRVFFHKASLHALLTKFQWKLNKLSKLLFQDV